ncbi:MAG: dTDP-4-dehydrorhamnose reductase [Bacteroidales bacterium]|jgi:dTDP-4-dehydrorhamnose reductase|nr:dTDP-4-dehydrorhamnose reductase [Bacteroidales bacterium]HPJ82569.1 dTDP-4-dehydrorhamnose reductase [Bacteroidales bacterium]
MKVVLTGASGGVGRIVQQLASGQSRMELAAYSRHELNILDKQALMDCLSSLKPEYLINTAAFTHVDQAEKEPEAAFLLNAGCLEGMAEACRKTGTTLIHLSTDYVFDGTKRTPYTEDDLPAPVNTYGASKRAGELIVLSYSRGIVVRTSWVYSRHSRNFLAAIPGLLRSQSEPLYVDTLQTNSPTYAHDLVNGLFALIGANVHNGLFHFTNTGGGCTRYAFACRIREMILKNDPEASPAMVLPMYAEVPGGAPRPVYTVMSPEKIAQLTGMVIPHWQEGIDNII